MIPQIFECKCGALLEYDSHDVSESGVVLIDFYCPVCEAEYRVMAEIINENK